MDAATEAHFKKNYQTHLQHLQLNGLRPKTIEAHSRAIRRVGARFDHQIDDLSVAAFRMVERPKIPRLGGAPANRGQP